MAKDIITETVKVRSLMERMDKKEHTITEAKEIERVMLNEAKGRMQVSRDQILDVLEKVDQSNGGQFVNITYITAKEVYKTKRAGSWRPDDVTAGLDDTKAQYGETGWHKRLTAYNDPSVKSSTANPLGAVIHVLSSKVNWTTHKSYSDANEKFNNALSDLRMKNGIGIPTNGKLGDATVFREKNAYGLYTDPEGRPVKDMNFASAKKLRSTYYVVNENGNIESEIPESMLQTMMAKKSQDPYSNVYKSEREMLQTPEALKAFSDAKRELEKNFQPRTLIFDNVLCIAGSVNGKSYYYINDNIENIITKKANVKVNPMELRKIAEEQLDEVFSGIQGFEAEE